MVIIGITGTLGAGKGTIVDYLIRKKGFLHFSARDFLATEVKKRELELNRDNFTIIANELRAKEGSFFLARALYNKAQQQGKNSIIESIRTESEVNFLREKENFYLLAVDADSEIRYRRIFLRASETDNVSYEKFLEDEQREMTSTDPNKQNLQACIQKADYLFLNNGTVEQLEEEVEKVLQKMNL